MWRHGGLLNFAPPLNLKLVWDTGTNHLLNHKKQNKRKQIFHKIEMCTAISLSDCCWLLFILSRVGKQNTEVTKPCQVKNLKTERKAIYSFACTNSRYFWQCYGDKRSYKIATSNALLRLILPWTLPRYDLLSSHLHWSWLSALRAKGRTFCPPLLDQSTTRMHTLHPTLYE